MIVRLIDATKVDTNAVLSVGVTVGSSAEVLASIRVPIASLQAAANPAAKRQLLLAAFRAQFQPPAPPALGVVDLGINVGDTVDLG